jgi:hypothetical protein
LGPVVVEVSADTTREPEAVNYEYYKDFKKNRRKRK